MDIRILKDEERGFKNLSKVAKTLTAFTHKYCHVKDTYFDEGSNLAWTTLAHDNVQLLDPKEWEAIVEAKDDKELLKVTAEIIDRI